jgi:hypothetical protein
MKSLARVLALFLVLGFAPGSFASILEEVYRQHRSEVLSQGVFAAGEYVFAVGRATSAAEVLDDRRAYKKARLLATGNLGYLAYEGVVWPSHLDWKAQKVLATAHLQARSQQYEVSELAVLDEFLDSERLHVAVVGVERERLRMQKLTFARIKRDLIELSEANLENCRLTMIRLEIMERDSFEANIRSIGQCLSNRIHPNLQAIFRMDVNSIQEQQRLEMGAFSDDQIYDLSQDELLSLYALQSLDARVAYWLGKALENNGYSRTADFIRYTGTIAGQSGKYARLNRESLSDDGHFVQYLNERMMEIR